MTASDLGAEARELDVIDSLDFAVACESSTHDAEATHAVSMAGPCCDQARRTWTVCADHVRSAIDCISKYRWICRCGEAREWTFVSAVSL